MGQISPDSQLWQYPSPHFGRWVWQLCGCTSPQVFGEEVVLGGALGLCHVPGALGCGLVCGEEAQESQEVGRLPRVGSFKVPVHL